MATINPIIVAPGLLNVFPKAGALTKDPQIAVSKRLMPIQSKGGVSKKKGYLPNPPIRPLSNPIIKKPRDVRAVTKPKSTFPRG